MTIDWKSFTDENKIIYFKRWEELESKGNTSQEQDFILLNRKDIEDIISRVEALELALSLKGGE